MVICNKLLQPSNRVRRIYVNNFKYINNYLGHVQWQCLADSEEIFLLQAHLETKRKTNKNPRNCKHNKKKKDWTQQEDWRRKDHTMKGRQFKYSTIQIYSNSPWSTEDPSPWHHCDPSANIKSTTFKMIRICNRNNLC